MANWDGKPPSLLGKPPIPGGASPNLLPSSGSPPSLPLLPANKSWASIAAPQRPFAPEPSPAMQKAQFDKLKNSIQDFVSLDPYHLSRMKDRMQCTLYAKFFGRALPLAHLSSALQAAWKDFGSVSVADMANGFYFLRCDSPEMQSIVLSQGPWTFGGMVLQLFPWRPNFQPAFEKLSTAAVWLQLHHFPMEFWHAEMLEDVAGKLGRVLKIDELTLNSSRARYARVCVELDLAKPLKQGFWVGFGNREAFITIQYESLPVFCFRCGLVGHAVASCTAPGCNPIHEGAQSAPDAPVASVGDEQPMIVDGAAQPMDSGGVSLESIHDRSSDPFPVENESFGPWMIVQNRRSRGGARPFSGHPRSRNALSAPTDTCHSDALLDGHVAGRYRASHVSSARGGRVGRGGIPRPFAPSRDLDRSVPPLSAPASKPYPEVPDETPYSMDGCDLDPPPNLIPDVFSEPPSLIHSLKGKSLLLPSALPPLSLPPSKPLEPLISSSHLHPKSSVATQDPSSVASPLLLSSSPFSLQLHGSIISESKAVCPPDFSEAHLELVNKVTSVFGPPLCSSAPLDDGKDLVEDGVASMLGSDSSGDLEEGTTLIQFQNGIRATSRKDQRRSKSGKKQGRISDPY